MGNSGDIKTTSLFQGWLCDDSYNRTTRNYFTSTGASTEENFTVLLHELAQILLGHTGHKELRKKVTDQRIFLPERPKFSRSTEELEAETVRYLISTKLRLIKRSEEYIAGYLKNIDDLMQFSYELVIKVADKIENTFLIPIRSNLRNSWNFSHEVLTIENHILKFRK